jgi:hypothetical protein
MCFNICIELLTPSTTLRAGFGFDGRRMVFRMTLEKLEPGKRVVWSCQGDHPEWNGTKFPPARVAGAYHFAANSPFFMRNTIGLNL